MPASHQHPVRLRVRLGSDDKAAADAAGDCGPVGRAVEMVERHEGYTAAAEARVARFVLAHESLAVVIVAVKTFIVPLLVLPARRALLRLLIVVGVLLAELFLRGGNETKIMFGVLVVILGGNRIAGALGIARKLDIFFRNVRSRAANFDVRAVRFVNARQRILAFAVVTASPHALLTISHVPVIAFCLSRR